MEMKEQHDELDKVQVGGCMAGFFNIFDRPQLLTSSSSSPVTCQSAVASPSRDSGIQQQEPDMRTRSPLTFAQGSNNKSPWRFSKEAPRLSLDSRAVVDAKGSLKPRQIQGTMMMGDRGEGENQRGSPGVIARLMGLEEPLPALQRSASESRVSRFVVDTFNFQNPVKGSSGGQRSTTRAQPARANRRRKSFFDSADFFPEPRQFDDLETLKQLLEALRLKGLLHSSNKRRSGMGNRNLVFDNHQSPPIKLAFGIRSGPGAGRRRTPERQQRRVYPLPWRRQTRASEEVNKQTIVQIWNVDEYNRQGKTLLERCDKLLHSIAEMAGDSQPSPVSVLDASLYHEDSSPSPVMKRSLDFEDESWGGSNSMVSVSPSEEYVYISDILRASDCLPLESDIFSLLEKHQYLQGKHNTIPHERRLIFDAVQEIVDRRRRLPPWRRAGEDDGMMQEEIWSEFQKVRNTRAESSAEDLVGYVCGVIGRDLSEDRWQDCEVEMSEAVLDIERLIFKDLIADTIRHLAALNRSHSLRRRLIFF